MTNHQGDKECHNVFMTCGNIKKDLRLLDSEKLWVHVGQIPVVKWKDKSLQGILNQRMLHRCLEIICKGAIESSHTAIKMVGPDGKVYKIRLLLGAYIADLPEALDLACKAPLTSPVTTARKTDFGNPDRCETQTGEMTLNLIREVVEEVGNGDLHAYKEAAKKRAINGAAEPFWRNWFGADPSQFYVPDALHQWFKLFIDHIWKWALALIGKEEMDKRLSVLQPVVGYRHFTRGVTRFKQHTGREQRDLMRYFVAILNGHKLVTKANMNVFRAFIDFAFIAQYKSHTDSTLVYLADALTKFHANLSSLSHLRKGIRMKGLFHIPKLELMHNVAQSIESLGSTDQFNSEQVEKSHIATKDAYLHTNKKEGYGGQMARHADRHGRSDLNDDFVGWCEASRDVGKVEDRGDQDSEDEIEDDNDSNGEDVDEDADEDRDADADEGDEDSNQEDNSQDHETCDESASQENETVENKRIRKKIERRITHQRLKALELMMERRRLRKVVDLFKIAEMPHDSNCRVVSNETTAFRLSSRIPRKGKGIREIGRLYKLESLKDDLIVYLGACPGGIGTHSVKKIDVWDDFRIQLRTVRDPDAILPLQRIQALPPSKEMPKGRCNFVLINNDPKMEYNGVCGMCALSLMLIILNILTRTHSCTSSYNFQTRFWRW